MSRNKQTKPETVAAAPEPETVDEIEVVEIEIEDEAEPGEPAPVQETVSEEAALPDGWYDMELAPHNGMTVHISANPWDGAKIDAVWKHSRRLEGHRWVSAGYWIDPITRQKITIDPVAWTTENRDILSIAGVL